MCMCCPWTLFSPNTHTPLPYPPTHPQRKRMLGIVNAYLAEVSMVDTFVSSTLGPAHIFEGMPPTLIQVGAMTDDD